MNERSFIAKSSTFTSSLSVLLIDSPRVMTILEHIKNTFSYSPSHCTIIHISVGAWPSVITRSPLSQTRNALTLSIITYIHDYHGFFLMFNNSSFPFCVFNPPRIIWFSSSPCLLPIAAARPSDSPAIRTWLARLFLEPVKAWCKNTGCIIKLYKVFYSLAAWKKNNFHSCRSADVNATQSRARENSIFAPHSATFPECVIQWKTVK